MKKLVGVFLGLGLLATSAACGGPCDYYCEVQKECAPDFAEDLYASQGYDVSCKWDVEEDEAEDNCVEACEAEYDRLSDSEAEMVDLCMECLEEKAGVSCKKYGREFFDDCEDECCGNLEADGCDDDEVLKWSVEVGEEWEPGDDMDCD